MLQPSSAYDGLGFAVGAFNRAAVAIFGAIILGVLAGLLAFQQQQTSPESG
jgi:hypothetical protein